MSRRDGTVIRELERALRRGPGHARDAREAPGSRGRADAASRAASGAACRLSERLAEQGLADVSYAPVDSPFGRLLLAASDTGLLRLAFPEEDEDRVLERLAARVSPRIV
jgi:hypothetical protein